LDIVGPFSHSSHDDAEFGTCIINQHDECERNKKKCWEKTERTKGLEDEAELFDIREVVMAIMKKNIHNDARESPT
jgi:hypothetical protein